MDSTVQFFPFHPLRLRWGMLVLALVGVILSARLVADAWVQKSTLMGLSSMACLALTAAMIFLHTQLRPRPEWGVRVNSLRMEVSLPLDGELVFPWREVKSVNVWKKGKYLKVMMKPGDSYLIPRSMFGSRSDFEKMVSAVEKRVPSDGFDA